MIPSLYETVLRNESQRLGTIVMSHDGKFQKKIHLDYSRFVFCSVSFDLLVGDFGCHLCSEYVYPCLIGDHILSLFSLPHHSRTRLVTSHGRLDMSLEPARIRYNSNAVDF